MKITVLGAGTLPKGELNALKALAAKGAVRIPMVLTSVGDFALFLVIDAKITGEVFNSQWENINQNYFDPNAWLAKRAAWHSEFLRPKKGAKQPIADAFEVEATNAYSAHSYLMDFYDRMAKTGWRAPNDAKNCVPANLRSSKDVYDEKFEKQWFFQRWWQNLDRKKEQKQLICEVLSRPTDLVKQYSSTNRKWREALLGPYSSSANNWVEMISQFSTVYQATTELADYLASKKFDVINKGAAAPDLSREALAKIISAPIAGQAEDSNEAKSVHGWFLDYTLLPTPELVDYLIAGMACGPDPVMDPKGTDVSFLKPMFNEVYSFFAREYVSESYLITPFGSSIHFTPPKLTDKSRGICLNQKTDLYGTVNYVLGNHLPDLTGKKNFNPFNGKFVDDNKKEYRSLAEYVFENLDPQMIAPVSDKMRVSRFNEWWSEHLNEPTKVVWENYASVYKKFIDKKFMPVMFDRSFRAGCRTKTTASEATNDKTVFWDFMTTPVIGPDLPKQAAQCELSPNAYRVAGGYMLSVELELRNYLRGMHSLFLSSLAKGDGEDVGAKMEFKERASALVELVQSVDENSLQGRRFETNLSQAGDQLRVLKQLVAHRLEAKPESADRTFQIAMLDQFSQQIEALLTDSSGQIQQVYLLERNGASSRVSAQKLNTPKSANPFLRRSGGG